MAVSFNQISCWSRLGWHIRSDGKFEFPTKERPYRLDNSNDVHGCGAGTVLGTVYNTEIISRGACWEYSILLHRTEGAVWNKKCRPLPRSRIASRRTEWLLVVANWNSNFRKIWIPKSWFSVEVAVSTCMLFRVVMAVIFLCSFWYQQNDEYSMT